MQHYSFIQTCIDCLRNFIHTIQVPSCFFRQYTKEVKVSVSTANTPDARALLQSWSDGKDDFIKNDDVGIIL